MAICKHCNKEFTPPPKSKRVYCGQKCYHAFRRTSKHKNPGTWKQGQSGNPNGRPPKGYSISEMMKEMLDNKPEVKASLGKVILDKALEGDMVAIKTLWQYMDGMPQQNVSGTLKVEKTYTDDQIKKIAERVRDGSSSDTSS